MRISHQTSNKNCICENHLGKYADFSRACKERRIKMEIVLSNNLCEMTLSDIENVNGGSVAGVVGAIAVGVIGVVAGPPAVVTGTVATVAWYTGSALIAAGGVASALGK